MPPGKRDAVKNVINFSDLNRKNALTPPSPHLKNKNHYTPLTNLNDEEENKNTSTVTENIHSAANKIPPMFIHDITN